MSADPWDDPCYEALERELVRQPASAQCQAWRCEVERLQRHLSRIYDAARQPDGAFDFLALPEFADYHTQAACFAAVDALVDQLDYASERMCDTATEQRFLEATGW
jgi:hypothetical protein